MFQVVLGLILLSALCHFIQAISLHTLQQLQVLPRKQLGVISNFALTSHGLIAEANGELEHDVMFAIKQLNLDHIHDILWDVSDPHSANYGRHLSRKEVLDMTRNAEGVDRVREFLSSIDATIIREMRDSHYIIARAPISTWQAVFATKFFEFEPNSIRALRTKSYSLPEHIASHVSAVVLNFPVVSRTMVD